MVRRSNIKVLKAGVLPFTVSVLFHAMALAIFALTNRNHDNGQVFTVELMTIASQMQNHPKSPFAKGGFNTTMDPPFSKGGQGGILTKEDEGGFKREGVVKNEENNRAQETVYPSTDMARKSRPVTDVKTVGAVVTPSAIVTYGSVDNGISGDGLPGGKQATHEINGTGIGNAGTLAGGSGKNIIEGEFGSVNGLSFLKMIKPEYPRLARRLGREGKVVLRLFIDARGGLLKVEVIEKAGYGFDEAAMDAVNASSFQPAKLNGHPVACRAVLPVRFRLE